MNEIVKFDNAQIDLIKRNIAKDATNDELKLFLYQCERTGLDPFARQIYSIKRSGRHVTQISIDGARLIAQRTGRYAGQDGPFWCGEDGVWRDVWLESKPPSAAKVLVFLLGTERGTPGVALWKEYSITNDMWKRMPALMLSKCAEMLALRKAFPMELSGLYAAEEMDQADNVIDAPARIIEATQTLLKPLHGHTQHKEAQAPRQINVAPVEPPTKVIIEGQDEYDKALNALLADETEIADGTPSDAVRIAFHVEGNRLFGKDWDKGARAWLVEAFTKSKNPQTVRTSSKQLVNSELQALTANMQDKDKSKIYTTQYAKKVKLQQLDTQMHGQLVAAAA